MTRAVSQLGQRTLVAMFVLLRNFTAFSTDNDPHGEHDMGALEIGAATVLWKIECYDRALEYASPDLADPEVTARVLTLMLAEEY